MAPTKKKKKPAGNPARGFATTSVPAKSSIVTGENVDDAVRTTHIESTSTTTTGNLKADVTVEQESDKQIHTLTPEDLEAHLEESSLQLLIDNFAAKSKKDASRLASKLKAEQRILRTQSEQLSVNQWLSDELVEFALNLLKCEKSSWNNDMDMDGRKSIAAVTEDDLILKLWTLELVLSELGFKTDDIQNAFQSILQKRPLTFPLGKDLIWGLEESLDYLALTCQSANLPDYDCYRIQSSQKAKKGSSYTGPKVNGSPTIWSTLKSSQTLESVAPSDVSTDKDFPDETDNESEDEIEPEFLTEKYLSLQSAIFKISSKDCEDISQKGSKKRSKLYAKASKTPEYERLLSKLRKIESDILFDRQDALSKWAAIRNRLEEESAERRKFNLDDNNMKSGPLPESSPSPVTSIDVDPQKNDESDDMLEELFSGFPELSRNSDTDNIKNIIRSEENRVLRLRDFGRWTGVNPRRTLEEACRSRDPSSQVIFNITSESSFSYQHSLVIEWSYSQKLPLSAYDDSFTCESSDYHAKFQMMNVSTPDASQSEAYISTVALFLIFACHLKEERLYFRLPSAFRDLWTEMSNARKEHTNAKDQDKLRQLKRMISEFDAINRDRTLSENNLVDPLVRKKKEFNVILDNKSSFSSQNASNNDLIRLWLSKSSTSTYNDMLKSRTKLPIWAYKPALLAAIENHQIVIVCGETGCGKSTQVPAFIIEHELSIGRECRVYCTQPRRISAISLARRVSEELGEQKLDIGTARSLIGYAIRLESQMTTQTRLVYATTGIVMRMLERSDDLGDITHLVLDEVHERSIDSDFLLIVLRKLVVRRPLLKVILMSATVDAERFSKYLAGAPILTVPGRTFPVLTKYLEDVLEIADVDDEETPASHSVVNLSEDENEIETHKKSAENGMKGYSKKTCEILQNFDEYRISYGLILNLLEVIATQNMYTTYSKAVLVFLPGIAEIRHLNNVISNHPSFSRGWRVHLLHSTIASEEQEQAFLVPPQGTRKIVLATNIAETGITIPDVTCVIDTGKHKEMRFDERRQLSRLIESFISRANAKQRRGRAGRVQNGICFHLFTKARYDNLMPEEQTPEMLRLSLQDLVLRVKICKLGGIQETLADALDPPSSRNIQRAIDALVDVKALTNGEELTALGRKLAQLPLDVFLGKLVLLGTIYQCLDGTLSIAAILSSKSPFSAPIGLRAQAELAKLNFKKGDSDLLTVYNAYSAWRRICNDVGSSEQQFCRKNFLSQQTLSNIEDLKAQLMTGLIDAGFLILDEAEKSSLNR